MRCSGLIRPLLLLITLAGARAHLRFMRYARDGDGDARPRARLTLDLKLAAGQPGPLAQTEQSKSVAVRSIPRHGLRREADPVVADPDAQAVGAHLRADRDHAGLG